MAELNAALLDVEEIVVKRPELTQEEWETVSKATDWIKATLKPEVRKELEIDYAKKQAELQTELRAETTRLVKEHMENWRKEQAPLSSEEMAKLLSQDYIEIPFPIKELRGKRKVHNFIICELPEIVEKKFVKAAQSFLIPVMEQINASEWHLDGSLLEQVTALLQKSPAVLDAAVSLATIVLNPWDEHKDITEQWVSENLSTPRICTVIMAQMEANRYRDFFFIGLRQFRSSKTS
jgi:hypothetical protein